MPIYFSKLKGSFIKDVICEGVESVPGLPPTIQIGYDTLENIEGATDELYNILLSIRTSLLSGQENVSMVGNTVITGAGIYTGGRSALGFMATDSPAAKGCYGMSFMCSAAAVASGGTAVMAKACTLSREGLLAESCSYAFMKLGELAHVAALHAEGKPIPSHLQHYIKNLKPRKPMRGSGYGNNYMGFIVPGGEFKFSEIIEKIPFQKIGEVVGLGFTVYGYYRIVLVGYRYSQKLITKYKENRKKIKLKNQVFVQAKTLVVFLYSRPLVRRNPLIHRFIISKPVVCY